ncbi:MAG TPA: Co2+/Mg2+ efflux protein ApaG [Aestuariivirga sp.]|jgi:ApaG protein|nr:Co2+/Mg2+ efflux protein ApaG [Aestuariivirga sp.]
MYQETTRQIRVAVTPAYLASQSEPDADRFLWSYTVTLENLGQETVQLLSRHWIITDARGHVQHVQGEGVVGDQPVLGPGDRYQYSSGCPLSTPSGIMSGSYQMTTLAGERFDIAIPAFSLDSPHAEHSVN